MADEEQPSTPAYKGPSAPSATKKGEDDLVPAATAPAAKKSAPIQRPTAKRMEFDVTRPFRYAWSFAKGTTTGLLDGMAHHGRKGMWAGLAVGVLLCIGGGFTPTFLVMGALGGMLAGTALGGVFGGATGGFKNVARSHRREKYADELAEHQAARATRPAQGQAPAPRFNQREDLAYRRQVANYNFDRSLQQENEDERDLRTYWQDREAARGHGHGFGKGY
jgi:hypothetical protein